MTTTRQPECRPTCAARRDPNAECVCAELEAIEAAAHRITPYVAWDRDESDPCQRGTVGCSINHVEPHNWSCETW